MTKNIAYYLIIISFLFHCCKEINENRNNSTNDNTKIEVSADVEKDGIEFLKEFYLQYMSAHETIEGNEIISLLIKTKLSEKLQVKIESANLDYDPIIDAQDVNIESINTLVVKVTGKDYKVCYQSSFSGEDICINLSLIKTNDRFLIDDIMWDDTLDENSNFIKDNANGIENPAVYHGSYENGLVLSYDQANKKFIGSINYESSSKCELKFFGIIENLDSKNEIPINVEISGVSNSIDGTLFLGDNLVRIKLDAPMYCQRVLDFKNGETFFKK